PLMGALAANAIGWGLWWMALLAALRIRRGLLRKMPARIPPAEQIDPGRRRLLIDAPLALVSLGAAGSVAEAAFVGPWRLTTAKYTVPIADLPACFDGLRIAHIADTHLGPRIPSDFVREAVRRAIDLKPDLFFLGGDYIHNGTHFIKPA